MGCCFAWSLRERYGGVQRESGTGACVAERIEEAMWRIGVIIVVVGFASVALSRPAGSVLAQCGSAYTDEMAGAGGTYGTSAECGAVQETTVLPAGEGALEERNATARDNPDAPPVDRGTATFEGERER